MASASSTKCRASSRCPALTFLLPLPRCSHVLSNHTPAGANGWKPHGTMWDTPRHSLWDDAISSRNLPSAACGTSAAVVSYPGVVTSFRIICQQVQMVVNRTLRCQTHPGILCEMMQSLLEIFHRLHVVLAQHTDFQSPVQNTVDINQWPKYRNLFP